LIDMICNHLILKMYSGIYALAFMEKIEWIKIYKFQRMKHCTSFTLIMQQTKFGEDKIWDMEMGIIQQEVTKICWID
ncbi:TPA: hypothetical protein ACG8KT_002583, partial [Enterococcus faecium]